MPNRKPGDQGAMELEKLSRFQPKFSKPKETFIRKKKVGFWAAQKRQPSGNSGTCRKARSGRAARRTNPSLDAEDRPHQAVVAGGEAALEGHRPGL